MALHSNTTLHVHTHYTWLLNIFCHMYIYTYRHIYAVVWAWVGEEFPDTRQDERGIKFIRVGWGESLPAQWASFLTVRESRCWTGVLDSFLYPGCKEWDRGLMGYLLIGWDRLIVGRGRKANTFSLYGEGGEIGYTSQEDLEFFSSYNIGDGREGW